MRKLEWNQFGIMNMNYLFYTLDYFLDAARDMGMQNINLWTANPHVHLDDATDDEFRAIGKKISDRGLHCFCVCPEQVVYPFNIAAEDEMIRSRSIASLKRAIDLCEILDTPLLHLCPGWGFYDQPDGLKRAWDLAGRLRRAESHWRSNRCKLSNPILSEIFPALKECSTR